MIFTNSIPIPRIATNERILSSFYSFIYLPHTKFEKKKKRKLRQIPFSKPKITDLKPIEIQGDYILCVAYIN